MLFYILFHAMVVSIVRVNEPHGVYLRSCKKKELSLPFWYSWVYPSGRPKFTTSFIEVCVYMCVCVCVRARFPIILLRVCEMTVLLVLFFFLLVSFLYLVIVLSTESHSVIVLSTEPPSVIVISTESPSNHPTPNFNPQYSICILCVVNNDCLFFFFFF